MVRVRMGSSSKRECVKKWLRVVNLVVNVWGVAMIIYSLCLRHLWLSAVSQLPSSSQLALPCPWFIFTCLMVGIIVCLSTLWGHMVANCINRPTLWSYVATLTTLLVLQGIVIGVVFFKMDMTSKINSLIDKKHKDFKTFVSFHFRMCCLVSILVFVAQMNILLLASILCMNSHESVDSNGVGDSETWEAPDLRSSFLVYPYSSLTTLSEDRTQS